MGNSGNYLDNIIETMGKEKREKGKGEKEKKGKEEKEKKGKRS